MKMKKTVSIVLLVVLSMFLFSDLYVEKENIVSAKENPVTVQTQKNESETAEIQVLGIAEKLSGNMEYLPGGQVTLRMPEKCFKDMEAYIGSSLLISILMMLFLWKKRVFFCISECISFLLCQISWRIVYPERKRRKKTAVRYCILLVFLCCPHFV